MRTAGVFVWLVWCTAACSGTIGTRGTVGGADAGSSPTEAGLPADAGPPADVGLPTDAALVPDASPPADVGVPSDAAPQADAAPQGDAARQSDAAPQSDTAPQSDAAPQTDAPPQTDAAPQDDAGPPPCEAVRYYSFALSGAVAAVCGGYVQPFDVTVPDEGYALGRATLVVRHVGLPTTGVIHYWSASVYLGLPEIQWAVGDDVCPGLTVTKTTLGTGTLGSGANVARVYATQGSSPCTDGAIEILPGSLLEVWVESPRAECRGAIRATSFYLTAGIGSDILWSWPTSMATVIGSTITTAAASESLRVLSVIEGTPALNPNTTCGTEAATLVSQTTVDGSIVSTTIDVVPASGGMGHLVLSSDATVPVGPGTHSFALLAGSNFTGTITTGGCCGDAVVAAVRLP